MGREELVTKYVQGQMSRRVFMRRLIATGVATAAAIAYADVLESIPASATTHDLYIYMSDYAFSPKNAKRPLGAHVDFGFQVPSTHHSATDTSGMNFFDTGFVEYDSRAYQPFPVAATYPYRCKSSVQVHPLMTGQVLVPIKATPKSVKLGNKVVIKWATSVPAGFVADVQRKDPGGSSFADWKASTTSKQTKFTAKAKGTYQFRSRLRRKSDGTHSLWSPTKSVLIT